MLKKISNLNGAQPLSKKEQLNVVGSGLAANNDPSAPCYSDISVCQQICDQHNGECGLVFTGSGICYRCRIDQWNED